MLWGAAGKDSTLVSGLTDLLKSEMLADKGAFNEVTSRDVYSVCTSAEIAVSSETELETPGVSE